MAALMALVFGLGQVMENLLQDGPWVFVLTLLLGNGVFLLTDQVLHRIGAIFRRRNQ